MQIHQQVKEDVAPGSGTLFALRAIGIVFTARWLQSMVGAGFTNVLTEMGSSPVAVLHLVYIFLLLALPGARPGTLHPFQPMPRWLRQLLRFLSCLGGLFALAWIVLFISRAGLNQFVTAVQASNGWVVVAPLLYFAAAWLCRRRALWRTRVTAGRFAIGCLGVEIAADTLTATVWDQNRKIGQYGANELSLRQERRGLITRVDLVWSSIAAAGHNRKRVFRVRTAKASDRASIVALDTALKRV